MSNALDIWEKPDVEELYMIAGWRQWADAGSISSRLPKYLVKQTHAKPIGVIRPDGFYMFQIPGTHDLVRPVIRLDDGLPKSVEARRNELYYAGDDRRGIVFFLGDEPHLDADRYATAFLDAARTLGVKRIISFGGVYGEMPYDKERMMSAIYSLPRLREEMDEYALNLSGYQGGASIGSYICWRASQAEIEFVGLYAFVPTFDFSRLGQAGRAIQLENDHLAWLGAMRRVNHMLNLGFDLSDLERRSEKLKQVVAKKVAELEEASPELGIQAYMERLSAEFNETIFAPLDDVWEQELRHILDDFDEAE